MAQDLMLHMISRLLEWRNPKPANQASQCLKIIVFRWDPHYHWQRRISGPSMHGSNFRMQTINIVRSRARNVFALTGCNNVNIQVVNVVNLHPPHPFNFDNSSDEREIGESQEAPDMSLISTGLYLSVANRLPNKKFMLLGLCTTRLGKHAIVPSIFVSMHARKTACSSGLNNVLEEIFPEVEP